MIFFIQMASSEIFKASEFAIVRDLLEKHAANAPFHLHKARVLRKAEYNGVQRTKALNDEFPF